MGGGAIACSDFESGEVPDPGVDAATDGGEDSSITNNDACAPGTCPEGGVVDPIVDLAPGNGHTCGLRQSGKVVCWGRNNEGQLGVEPASDLACDESARCRTGIDVPGVANVTHVSAGKGFTCARSNDGIVKCWGNNAMGTLGLGSKNPTTRFSPEVVPALPGGALDVSVGLGAACARVMNAATSKVDVYCWGYNGRGLSTAAPSDTVFGPTVLPDLTNAKAVVHSVQEEHVCAIREDDTVVCWGKSDSGSLGHAKGTMNDISCVGGIVCNPKPSQVGDASFTVKEISVSNGGGCARMLADNTLRCWGYAGFGLVGQGVIEPGEQPTPLTVPIGAVSSFSSRGAHACAVVAADKTLRCWGFNGAGELANQNAADACGYFAPCKSSPQMTTFPATGGIIERVYSGVASSYVRVEGGTFYAWGANPDARLGHVPGTSNDLASCRSGYGRCNPNPQPMTFP